MILLIDNYDSFVYNLARYVSELGFSKLVKRNDAVTIAEIAALRPDKIIISPGPCTPNEAGITLGLIQFFGNKLPILGVCLGHQAIGQVYGGQVKRSRFPMHGKASAIHHNQQGLFTGLATPMQGARYHSLIVDSHTLPEELQVTAYSEDQEIMGLQHKKFPVFGVQFHPESVLTQQGYALLENFLKM